MTLPDTIRRVRWHLRMAELIPEPRVIRAFYFVGYLLTIIMGLSCLIRPLQSWEGTVGLTVTYAWAVLLLLGGVIAAASVFTIYWAVERVGIVFAGGGWAIYAIVTLLMHFSSEQGNRIPQTCALAFGVLMLVLRFVRIRGAIVEPGR